MQSITYISAYTSLYIACNCRCLQLYCKYLFHTHTTVLWPFFRDHPGEPVPEENFWKTLWCKGRLTEADTPDHPAGCHSLRTNQCPPPPSQFLQAGCHPTNSVKALKATSAFGLGRRRQSSAQRCYLHRLRTLPADTCLKCRYLQLIADICKSIYLSIFGQGSSLLWTHTLRPFIAGPLR